MYMISHPSAISSAKIAFIIVWKVAGELVSLKNMTVGSNSPWLVMNAALCSLPSLMQILLYPHLMSTLVNLFAFWTRAISSEIKGSG